MKKELESNMVSKEIIIQMEFTVNGERYAQKVFSNIEDLKEDCEHLILRCRLTCEKIKNEETKNR